MIPHGFAERLPPLPARRRLPPPEARAGRMDAARENFSPAFFVNRSGPATFILEKTEYPHHFTRNPTTMKPTRTLLIGMIGFCCSHTQAVAGDTWDGGGGDNNWQTGDNWNQNGAPGTGSDKQLTFSGTTRLTPNNDYGDFSSFKNIIFSNDAGAFTLSGNSIDLYGKIQNDSSNTQIIGLATIALQGGSREFNPISGNLIINSSFIYTNNNPINIYGPNGNNVTFNGEISQGGGLTILENSNVILSGGNTYTGQTSIWAGTLQVTSSGKLGTGDLRIALGAMLDISGSSSVASLAQRGDNDGGTVTLASGSLLTINGANKGASFQNSIHGSGSLTMAGSGNTTLALYNPQSYTGTTIVSGGKITTSNTMATKTVIVSGGGIFESQLDNLLSDSVIVSISGGTLEIQGSDTVGSLTSTGGSIVLGSGKTLTVAGSSSIGSGSTITGGSLAAGGGNLTFDSTSGNTSAVLIKNGARLLGTGTIGGATTIQSGGYHSAGALNAVGTQNFSSTLNYAGSIFEWQLDAATEASNTDPNQGSYDKVNATGAVTGTSKFEIILGSNSLTDAFWDTNKSWSNIFLKGTGSSTLASIFTTFSGTGVASDGSVMNEGRFGFSGDTLNWTAVPEVSNLLAGVLLGAGLLRRRRRTGGAVVQ